MPASLGFKGAQFIQPSARSPCCFAAFGLMPVSPYVPAAVPLVTQRPRRPLTSFPSNKDAHHREDGWWLTIHQGKADAAVREIPLHPSAVDHETSRLEPLGNPFGPRVLQLTGLKHSRGRSEAASERPA
jgi:hypothetical protein